MKNLIAALFLILLSLTSCSQGKSVASIDDDPYKDIKPLFNGDSLKEVYPLAFAGNIIQREEFEKAVVEQILTHVGQHIKSIEIQPWKVDEMMEINADSFYVSFKRLAPGAEITLLTKLSRETAATLAKYEWYEVIGIFTGFPPSPFLRPHIDSYEIELGVFELDSAKVQLYPKDKRAYWEKAINSDKE